ncbi:CDP-alcohol phosphatidyltransferase family protein [Arthrobacter sp. TMN-49]
MTATWRQAEGPSPVHESLGQVFRRLSLAQKGAGLHAPAYSRFINRKMGRVLAAAAYKAGMTPNLVTVISALFTYAGIALLVIVPPGPVLGVAVGLLLVIGYAFDSADGQLARLRGGGSPAGEWLDHIADAVKISALPVFLAVGLYRFEAVPVPWLLIPLASAIVGPVYFFAMILTEQLRRSLGTVMPTAHASSGRPSWTRSVMVLPMDYGVLCLSFLLMGVLPLFMGLYAVTVAATAGFTVLALVKWFRELQAATRTPSLPGDTSGQEIGHDDANKGVSNDD